MLFTDFKKKNDSQLPLSKVGGVTLLFIKCQRKEHKKSNYLAAFYKLLNRYFFRIYFLSVLIDKNPFVYFLLNDVR